MANENYVIAWCEGNRCGKPIYKKDKKQTILSSELNEYFFCEKCKPFEHTPDGGEVLKKDNVTIKRAYSDDRVEEEYESF